MLFNFLFFENDKLEDYGLENNLGRNKSENGDFEKEVYEFD